MTLTLQDLFVSTDVSAPAPRAAAAPVHAPSDPFAAFFNHATDRDPTPNNTPHDSSDTASSQSTAPSAKDHHASRTDNARENDGNDNAPRPHHKSRSDSTTPTPADDARAADKNKASRDAATADNGNSNTAATASDTPAAPINLFQVALLAAQSDASNAADQSAPATPQVSASPAIGSATTDTAASAATPSTADMTALLAGQDDAAAPPTPTALPVDFNAQENLPVAPTPTTPVTPTAGDIAILNMASPPAGQAANAPALAPRPTDNRAAPTATQTSNGLSTRTSGAGRPQSDDIVKTDASSSMSAPSDNTTLPTDPMVVPLAPTGLDTASSDDNTAAQPDNSSASAVGSNAVSTGVTTAQQAQTLYTKTAGRTDSLPQVTIDQVAMHLTKAADDGIDHLTIHLKPAELGSIEVKLEMGDDGINKATITADRQDTLNLMQRDSHRLEQALDNAGLKTDPGSLSFNLRGDGGRNNPNFAQGNGSPYAPYARSTTDDAVMPVNPALLGYINSRAALGGIDIRV